MLQLNDDYIRRLIETVNSSPFPRHLPMRLTSIELDRAVVACDTAACHLQPFGIVHGGVLATLIDTATFWSVFMRLPQDAGLVNIDLKLNYLRPVSKGTITARGKCIRSGRSISYAEARVTDAAGQLLAHGTSTLMALPGKGIHLGVEKFIEDRDGSF
ncbi:MAG: PaaI family thioesterase [Desulfobacterales bacterium]